MKVIHYINAETAEALRKGGRAEWKPTHAVTYNIVTDSFTEWHFVADDDPRLNTIETTE